jgi:acyl carrier protein
MKEKIKAILLENFIDVENTEELTYELPLLSSGILDSISILQLVDLLEKEFTIEFEPHELDKDLFDTINKITDVVESKKK